MCVCLLYVMFVCIRYRLDGERISENRRVLDESNDNSSFGHMVDEWLDNRDTHKWRVELESDRRYRGQRVSLQTKIVLFIMLMSDKLGVY